MENHDTAIMLVVLALCAVWLVIGVINDRRRSPLRHPSVWCRVTACQRPHMVGVPYCKRHVGSEDQ